MVHFKSTPLFQIRLDNDNLIMSGSKTESVGCVLRGQLVLVITEQTKFKEIRLSFQGKSKVGWVDGIGKGQYPHNEERIIFQHDWVFLPAKKQCHVLNPNNYHWDFELILPGSLPETIEGCQHGSLRYNLNAIAERNAFALNLHAKRKITIMRSISPSSIEYVQSSIMANTWTDKIVYEFSAGTKISGLGDRIPIMVNLRSLDENLKVQEILCIFKEYATYSVGTNQKTDTKTIKYIKESNFSKDVDYWNQSMEMLIPNDSTLCLYDSQNDFIRVIHKLKFYVTLINIKTGLPCELRASLPIVITLNNDNLPAYDESYLTMGNDDFENILSRSVSTTSSASSTFSSTCCSLTDSLCEIEEMSKLPSYSSISSFIPAPLSDSLLPPTYDASIGGH